MAFTARPPTAGLGSSRAVIQTATWSGLGRRQPIPPFIGPVLLAPASASGAQILAQGQYHISFSFAVETTDTTTAIQIRATTQGADGALPPVDFSAPSTGDIITGCYECFTNVTVSDLLANDVYVLIQAAALSGTEDINWVHSQLSIQRVGDSLGEATSITSGCANLRYVAKSSDYTATLSDCMIECITGSFNVTLLSAVNITGKRLHIDNSGTGTITLLTTASQTIHGEVSGALTLSQDETITVISNGANWRIE